ncbi:hypothetical protein HY745_11710 [Candidatus Desantisbacteria bacterium]|nr:hypothetical protein [Candidatus Desantisbacteria bacterium]
MVKYQCKVCGYIHNCISIDGHDQVPEKCPVCGANQPAFVLMQPSIIKWSDHFKLFQPGWWILHFTGISLVYILGRLIFK